MQASLGFGQSLKEFLAKVYELPVGEPAHDTLLRSAVPFVATLAESDEEAGKVCSIVWWSTASQPSHVVSPAAS